MIGRFDSAAKKITYARVEQDSLRFSERTAQNSASLPSQQYSEMQVSRHAADFRLAENVNGEPHSSQIIRKQTRARRLSKV